jgi:D-alanine-D-alanine ligase
VPVTRRDEREMMNGVVARKGIRVAVLYGGPSSEHLVSRASALAVLRALPRDRYAPMAVGIDRSGGYHLMPQSVLEDACGAPAAARPIDDRIAIAGRGIELRRGRPGPHGTTLALRSVDDGAVLGEADVAFPVMHGAFGEDGVVQGMLESLAVPYVGCGVLGSAVCMDKVATKRALAADGIPIAAHVWLDDTTWANADDPQQVAVRLTSGLRAPLFVKPAASGSSLGITRVVANSSAVCSVGARLSRRSSARSRSPAAGSTTTRSTTPTPIQ